LTGVDGSFGAFVTRAGAAGRLVVQPRMGMSDPRLMRAGLVATRDAAATTVGTITLDSYTRVGDHAAARAALRDGLDLNGYPVVAHDLATTAGVLDGVLDARFPVQVRHGSAAPQDIVAVLVAAGLHATEGGPVSYCLPYSRIPLRESVLNWAECCMRLAAVREHGIEPHLESFGGCMMGQLCPPSLLVAISVLEGLFFRQHGLRSVSLSYAQQTNQAQDMEAVRSLRQLAAEHLHGLDWHVVIYAYMGVYPRTPDGASLLLEQAARLAVCSGAQRLIVKTVAEAHRIPTIAENVAALELAARAADDEGGTAAVAATRTGIEDTGILAEARALVNAVLDLSPDLGVALVRAFERGYLDVPFCLHPDNPGRARSRLDDRGRLHWSGIGSMPLGGLVRPRPVPGLTAAGLLRSLSYVERRYDHAALERSATGQPAVAAAGLIGDEPVNIGNDAARPPGPREHLASPVTRTVLTIQHRMLDAAREYLRGEGFTELLPPVIGPVTDPGARGAKQVDVDYYGHRYKLMTSAILYKQASLTAFDKIFCIAPNVRLEPLETSSTSRHLAEFHQVDVEMAGATRERIMAVAEGLVSHVVRRVVTELPAELESLGRDTSAFADLLDGGFERRTHAAAVADLHGMGHDQNADAEIDWVGEAMLSHKSSRPFFITDYPKGSRGFYDRENTERPGFLRNFDLIAAEGYGELCSGSERENDYATIVTRMRETGENPAKYGWYLRMVRDGVPASAGFGIGLERFTRYVAGLDHVWQASAYPKVPGVVAP
jgi:aspartyl/asparaginyl-tRNA synthetase/glutamate mutase epsilon subunit